MWLGQIFSQFGDRLTQLVLVGLVAQRAPGSTLTLAKVLVATSLPALFVNPIAGVYVDRWNRKRTMIACDFLRAGALVALPWLASIPNALTLYIGVFFIFAVATFFVPARLALIPDLVPANRLAQANSLLTTSGMIGSTMILLVGALLVERVGPMISSFVNALCYLFSALSIVFILAKRKGRMPPVASLKGILREIQEGMKELLRHHKTRQAGLLLGFLMAGAGASVVAATVLVQESFGSVTKDLGFLSLWIGIGMLVGSVAFGRWGATLSRRIILGFSFLGFGAALWLFVAAVVGFKSSVGASLAAAFLGFWVAPVGIVANTLVHEGHPGQFHGRIFSGLGVSVNLSLITSMLVAGKLVEQGGRGAFLAAVGIAFAAGGLFLLCYTKRRVPQPS